MILASDVLDAMKREYPVNTISGPEEMGEYYMRIGPIKVMICPHEWIASAARELKYHDNGSPELKLLRKFPNDYEMGKATISFDKPENFETASLLASTRGFSSMTLKQEGKKDYHSIFKFDENFENMWDVLKIMRYVDELSEIVEYDMARVDI